MLAPMTRQVLCRKVDTVTVQFWRRDLQQSFYFLPLLYQLSSVPPFKQKKAGVFHHQPFTGRLRGTGGRTSGAGITRPLKTRSILVAVSSFLAQSEGLTFALIKAWASLPKGRGSCATQDQKTPRRAG
jgi:hypothetical protein